ncbi:MAG: putative quinol monooxygenase [Janthinobacterium lividum]
METQKFMLLAEVTVLPEFLTEITALAKATLLPTLKEPGCEIFVQTAKQDDPNTLIFFEVFSSEAANQLHLDAPYTKDFFAGVQGKLAKKPTMTLLHQL